MWLKLNVVVSWNMHDSKKDHSEDVKELRKLDRDRKEK